LVPNTLFNGLTEGNLEFSMYSSFNGLNGYWLHSTHRLPSDTNCCHSWISCKTDPKSARLLWDALWICALWVMDTPLSPQSVYYAVPAVGARDHSCSSHVPGRPAMLVWHPGVDIQAVFTAMVGAVCSGCPSGAAGNVGLAGLSLWNSCGFMTFVQDVLNVKNKSIYNWKLVSSRSHKLSWMVHEWYMNGSWMIHEWFMNGSLPSLWTICVSFMFYIHLFIQRLNHGHSYWQLWLLCVIYCCLYHLAFCAVVCAQ
jgi:hypothetical protein